MADRTVLVELKASTAAFQKSMRDAAGSMKGLDAEQQRAQKRAAMWTAVGKASTVAGAGIAAGLLYTTKAASAQEQALGALGAVFKQNTAAMADNAKGATQIGLSTTQYANSAAKLGAQLGNLGVDQAQLGTTTDDLIRKAADMAAQFGGPTSEAVDAIGAALRGERDPIERYGVTLTETGIKAEMAATGLDKTAATLSLLNKQLASSGTIGAAAREFDTTAAATQRMQAEFQNAQAALGTALLPAMTQAASAASGLLGWFNSLPQPLQQATTYSLALAAALGVVGPKAMVAGNAIRFYAISLATYSKGAGAVMVAARGLGLIGLAAAGMVAVGKAIQSWQFGTVTEDVAQLQRQLSAFASTGVGDIGRFGTELGGFREDMQHIAEQMDNPWVPFWTGWSFGPVLEELGALDSALVTMPTDEAAAAFQRLQDQAVSVGWSVQDFADQFPKYTQAVAAAKTSTAGFSVLTDAAAGSLRMFSTAGMEAAAAARSESDAMEKLRGDIMGVMQAQLALVGASDALYGARKRLGDAIDANGKSLNVHTEAGRANRAAIMQEVGAIVARGDAMVKAGKSQAAADAWVAKHTASLRRNAIAAGFSAQQVDALLAAILGLPPNTNIKLALQGATAAEKQLRNVAKAANDAGKDVTSRLQLFGGPKAKKDLDDVTTSAKKVPRKVRTDTDAPGAVGSRKDLDDVTQSAGKIPTKVRTDTDAPGSQGAKSDLDNVTASARTADNQSPSITVSTNAYDAAAALRTAAQAAIDAAGQYFIDVFPRFHIASGGPVLGFAPGGSTHSGPVHGPGTTTSDSIPARLSRGEFVMNAAAVSKYGLGLMFALNARKLAGGGPVGLAAGGVPADLVDPATGKRYVWADQRWIEYNPRNIPKGPSTRPVWREPQPFRKPERKDDEGDEAYRKRVEAKREARQKRIEQRRRNFDKRLERFRNREQALGERRRLIEREKLDHKWEQRDKAAEAAAQRRADAAAAVAEEHARRVEEAQQRLDDIVAKREQLQQAVYGAMTGDWAGTFNFDAAAEATQRLADAQNALADARTAAATAAPGERQQAIRNVAAARAEEKAARKAAAAAAPTPGNVLKAFQDRTRKAKEYSAGMQWLTGRGVSQDLLAELGAAGPEAAAPMLAALKRMTPAQIKSLNWQIQATKAAGMSLAGFLGDAFYGDQQDAAARALWNASARPANVTVNIGGAQPITLKLDSREIWKGQLRLQRQTGNTYTFVTA